MFNPAPAPNSNFYMSSADSQIVALYEHETEPMTIEEICQATELDETVVKVALMQGSRKYNEALQKSTEEFSTSDKEMMKMVMKQLAMSSEAPNVRFRAAKYVYEEAKGRNDVRSAVKSVNINVNTFNQTYLEIEAAKRRALEKVVDVNPEHAHLKEIAQAS